MSLSEDAVLIGAGALITHLWERIRGRITHISYSVWHQPLGRNVNDNLFGSVKILYNDNPTSNLFFSTVVVENHSSKDIENLEVNLYCDENTLMLISHGYMDLSPNALKFTEEFSNLLEEAKNDPALQKNAMQRRDYKIPCINRGETVRFQILSSNPVKQPEIYCNSDKAGVKMRYSLNLKDFKGETAKHCAWTGSVIAILLCIPIMKYTPNEYLIYAIIPAATLGLFAMILGWATIKILKTITRIIG